MITFNTIILALLGGILPALLWLWFWLKEDKKAPEPRRLIFLAFFIGMLSIPFVIVFQKYAVLFFGGIALIVVWATIEEVLKYVFAYFSVLRNKEMNEPIDAVIYMITVALGFAALENALFLIDPLSNGNFVSGILTGNFRFFGATLLHVLSSATVGVFIALSFYKSKTVKRVFVATGIILAVLLHSVFNFLIINSSGADIFFTFAFVWAGIIFLMLVFEKIKQIKKPGLLFFRKKQ